MDLLRQFRRTIESMGILHPGDPVVIGVSGGADSLVLLHLFSQSRDVLGIIPHAVHVHHGIRGDEADQDAAFVAQISADWGIPSHIEPVDAPRIAQENKLSLEDAARRARYMAFTQIAEKIGAKVIVVAHNADDQAETVLMHFLRGSGLAGLRGMLPVAPLSESHLLPNFAGAQQCATPDIIRPLLNIPRTEINAYCAAHDLHPHLDATNLDTGYTRNRLRREIIPLLETVNPNLKETLGRSASIFQADNDLIEANIDDAWIRIKLDASPSHIHFRLSAWRNLPLALQRGALRRAIADLSIEQHEIGFQHIEDALQLALHGSTGMQVVLPDGIIISLSYDVLIVSRGRNIDLPADWPLLAEGTHMDLPAGGIYPLSGSAWQLVLELCEGRGETPADQWSAMFIGSPPFQLRTRQRGDRFYPQGAGGSQKLSDFMINAKIPVHVRDKLPLLTANGEIVWLCGFRVDERFIVRPETKTVWVARFEKIQVE